jgi:putative flippase GtrA
VNTQKIESGLMQSLLNNRLFMYALIGGSASAIDVGIFVFMYEWLGSPALLAHSVSIPVSALFSFGLNAVFNFRKTDKLLARFLSFAVIVAMGYALGAGIIWSVEEWTTWGGTVGKLLSLPVVFVFQYFLNSRISFRG